MKQLVKYLDNRSCNSNVIVHPDTQTHTYIRRITESGPLNRPAMTGSQYNRTYNPSEIDNDNKYHFVRHKLNANYFRNATYHSEKHTQQ